MPSKHRLRPKLPVQQFKPRLEQRFKRVNIFRKRLRDPVAIDTVAANRLLNVGALVRV